MAEAAPPSPPEEPAPVARFLPKPKAIDDFETRLGRAVPVHPNVLSLAKLFVVTPLVALGLFGGVAPLLLRAHVEASERRLLAPAR